MLSNHFQDIQVKNLKIIYLFQQIVNNYDATTISLL